MRTRAEIVRGALAGAAAGLAAVATMYLLASLAGTRTLPALLSEPFLALMPGPLFGFLIDRLQHLGKVLEELGLLLAMVVLLAGLGAAVAPLRLRRPRARLTLVAAAGAWLVVMLLALPQGGAGLFGLGDGIATPVVWAVVFAIYAFVLEMGLGPPSPGQEPVDEGRRWLIGTAPAAIALVSAGYLALRLVPGWVQAVAQPAKAAALSDEVTPVKDFYVVSKNFNDPAIDAGSWALNVHGLAAGPFRLAYADFRALPQATVLTTLECISNNVGGNQISTGEFAGVRLAELVQRAQPSAQAKFVNFRSRDGYTESLPIDLVLSDPDILVAHSLGGAPLTTAHGFPARVLIPGRYGMKGPKWLEDIELAVNEIGGYWESQGWDRQAIVKTMARIDTPLDGAIIGSGAQTVGGVAFAGTRGIWGVELSADGGRTWAPAALRPSLSPLTWVIWTFQWAPGPGEHTLAVRATDGRGAVQTADVQPSFPSGSSGYHEIRVSSSG
jgi:DMSO/TMAO reductase YedYZ molybdopterin-dependent catalytic subunit